MKEDKLQLLFHTSLDSSLLFTGTRVPPLPLPSLLGMIHEFVLYCLPKAHKVLSVCMRVSEGVSGSRSTITLSVS